MRWISAKHLTGQRAIEHVKHNCGLSLTEKTETDHYNYYSLLTL